MVAFICTLLVGFVGVAVVLLYGKRRPVGAPLSWGEAMAASVTAMFLFLWWYGVIPHQWLTYAEGELTLRPRTSTWSALGHQPLTISYRPGRPDRRRHLRRRARHPCGPVGGVERPRQEDPRRFPSRYGRPL